MQKPSLLFCASEVYPFAKTGGLADVAHSLPRALRSEYDVDVVMPLYSSVKRERFGIQKSYKSISITLNGVSYPIDFYKVTYEETQYLFVYSPLLCDKEFLYGPPSQGYEDNALRFALFCHAIVDLVKENSYTVTHLNDWQTALCALLIKEDKEIKTKTVFTIHNLAYQGIFHHDVLKSIGINERYFTMDALEYYSQVNFMKAGIAFADRITTVSKTYAKEILTPAFGYGLEGFLSHHKAKLTGIVNGIDAEHFSPSEDTFLVTPFHNLTGKLENKKAYLKEAGLQRFKKPLFIFIGRFTYQKGIDLLLDILPSLAMQECNIAILGEGEEKYHTAISTLAKNHKNIHFDFTYNEALSHRMYAAADFLLMPSYFEPCGLNQMIAMKYGALAIVHQVGGLKDTVKNIKQFDKNSQEGFGIPFKPPTSRAFLDASKDALALYKEKKEYNKIVKHNMLCDFSWSKSAALYINLYKNI